MKPDRGGKLISLYTVEVSAHSMLANSVMPCSIRFMPVTSATPAGRSTPALVGIRAKVRVRRQEKGGGRGGSKQWRRW